MHLNDNRLNDNRRRSVAALPLRAREGEVFTHRNGACYDVTRAVKAICDQPAAFQRGLIPLSALAEHVRQRGKFDSHYIAAMSHPDARRPVVIGHLWNGTEFLLDGSHRAARSLQLGYHDADAWLLRIEQTELFRASAPAGPNPACF